MILLFLIIIGVAIFCLYQGYVIIGIICLAGFSKRVGWPALFITSGYLFIMGHWFMGALPLLLMGWNLIGLRYINKKKPLNRE